MNTNIGTMDSRLLPRIALIACGSFSPPTPMHLRMFEIARDYFKTAGTHKVIGGIASPVHDGYGKKDLAPAPHRLEMLKLALKSSSWVRLSDWEVQQSNHSRTILVLQFHQNYMNNHINSEECDEGAPSWLPNGLRDQKDCVQLKLLCGADLLESFAEPGLWAEEDIKDIVGTHGLVVITRAGANPERFIFENDLLTKYQKNITLITNWVTNDVSSTMIRRLLRRQLSVKYLIDDFVIDYCKKHGLYGSKPKYITTIESPTDNVCNQAYIDQMNIIVNSNKSTSSIGTDDDDVDADANVTEEHMDEINFTRNILNSCDSKIGGNGGVLCCKKSHGKLTMNRSRPGQAVQVITRENAVSELMHEETQRRVKRIKVSAVQDI